MGSCAWGTGGQKGGFQNEDEENLQRCAKSVEAIASELMEPIPTHFFERYTISELQQLSSMEADRLGRLSFPVIKHAHSDRYERISWEQVYQIVTESFQKAPERLASYYNPQCYGTDKRVCGTYGGDRTDYFGAVSANTAALETIMVLLNATVSEPGATFTTADIKDFFLMSDLSRPEYMWIQLSQIPDRIQRAYNIADFAINERVLVEITKGIYG